MTSKRLFLLVLASCALLSSCAIQSTEEEGQRILQEWPKNPGKPVWLIGASDPPTNESDALPEDLVIPVCLEKRAKAMEMLKNSAFVVLDNMEAQRLIGRKFSVSAGLSNPIKEAESRAEDRKNRAKEDPANPDWERQEKEYRAEAKQLKAYGHHAKPYLMRGVGFLGCGTGRFYAVRSSSNEVWTSFGGLGGSGLTPYVQPLVVYLDKAPVATHVQGPSTAL